MAAEDEIPAKLFSLSKKGFSAELTSKTQQARLRVSRAGLIAVVMRSSDQESTAFTAGLAFLSTSFRGVFTVVNSREFLLEKVNVFSDLVIDVFDPDT